LGQRPGNGAAWSPDRSVIEKRSMLPHKDGLIWWDDAVWAGIKCCSVIRSAHTHADLLNIAEGEIILTRINGNDPGPR
jgi:hypothetical protein